MSEPDGLCKGLSRIVTWQMATALIRCGFFFLSSPACLLDSHLTRRLCETSFESSFRIKDVARTGVLHCATRSGMIAAAAWLAAGGRLGFEQDYYFIPSGRCRRLCWASARPDGELLRRGFRLHRC